jgi:PAS domain S-box-containing protein
MARGKVGPDDALVGAETHGSGLPELAAIYGEREEFHRTILDRLADGVVIMDREDRILYVNARMKDVSGYSPDERIGRIGYEVLFPRKDWDRMRRRLRERRSGSGETYEIELVRKEGGTSWIRIVATPYRSAGVISSAPWAR